MRNLRRPKAGKVSFDYQGPANLEAWMSLRFRVRCASRPGRKGWRLVAQLEFHGFTGLSTPDITDIWDRMYACMYVSVHGCMFVCLSA